MYLCVHMLMHGVLSLQKKVWDALMAAWRAQALVYMQFCQEKRKTRNSLVGATLLEVKMAAETKGWVLTSK